MGLDPLAKGLPVAQGPVRLCEVIRSVIDESPNRKLLISDIYMAIESKFPYYSNTAPSTWKNAVRRHLANKRFFKPVPRPLTDPGKGNYWSLTDTAHPRATTSVGVLDAKKKSKKKSKKTMSVHTEITEGGHHSSDKPYQQQYSPPYSPGLCSSSSNYQPARGCFYSPSIVPEPTPSDTCFDMQENGNVDWRMEWLKELDYLQQVTAENEKAGVGSEWYNMMVFRIWHTFDSELPQDTCFATETVDWHKEWLKELRKLQVLTAEMEKARASSQQYSMMVFRLWCRLKWPPMYSVMASWVPLPGLLPYTTKL